MGEQESLAVASIARNDPSALPGDDPFPRARMHRDRNAGKLDRNLKPKLALMRQCTSVTDRQTDTDIALKSESLSDCGTMSR